MLIEAVELHRLELPLVSPFRTSFGTQTGRDVLLVRVVGDGLEGWGECVAMAEPHYSAEYVDGAEQVCRDHLVPRLLAADDVRADDVARLLAPVIGHRMAKAAIEMAVLDVELRSAGRSWAEAMGATVDRIPSGVSVGIADDVPALLEAVADYLDQGYVRIKLKIEPGWDLEPVAAVRDRFGEVPLQVDANTAYTLADADHLARLDAFDLLLIEQPLPEDALLHHARLAERLTTPVCLDESIVSLQTCLDAIEVGATEIVNVKPGRVGGYLEARRIVDACRDRGVPAWCGGMVETGLGRAANAALAAHPGMTLPGDVSAASRFYARDIVTDPVVLQAGHVGVPTRPGLGVDLDRDFMDEVTTSVTTVRR